MGRILYILCVAWVAPATLLAVRDAPKPANFASTINPNAPRIAVPIPKSITSAPGLYNSGILIGDGGRVSGTGSGSKSSLKKKRPPQKHLIPKLLGTEVQMQMRGREPAQHN